MTSRPSFSPASLAAGLVLVALGAWILAGGVTFGALIPVFLGGVGLILLTSGLARRR
ncbi:MAG: hypothetical protein QOH62_3378 [Solirubrobacteraceae bacterium]|nr:hypothetical protein [Solirubrobacteraceae bacterium]